MGGVFMNYKGFEKAVVIFIDILGTKERSTFDEMYKIADIFCSNVKREKEFDEFHPWTVYKREITIFSDCAYIIYDFKDNIEDNRKDEKKLINISLYNTEKLIFEFLKHEFISRGSITYGDVYYETDRGIFFGPAINRAYELESKYAKYPRIIIDPEIADEIYLFNAENYLADSVQKCLNGEIIKKDDDDIYFLNYLNSFKLGRVNFDYDSIFEFINKELYKERETPELTKSIRNKYNWLNKYLKNSLPTTLNNIDINDPNVMSKIEESELEMIKYFMNGNLN